MLAPTLSTTMFRYWGHKSTDMAKSGTEWPLLNRSCYIEVRGPDPRVINSVLMNSTWQPLLLPMDDPLAQNLAQLSLSNHGLNPISQLQLRRHEFPISFSHPQALAWSRQPRDFQIQPKDDDQSDAQQLKNRLARGAQSIDNSPPGALKLTSISKTHDKYANPDGRRACLIGWLYHVNLLCCHVTHMPACARLLIQFCHVLLPKADGGETDIVSHYTFFLLPSFLNYSHRLTSMKSSWE